MLPSRIACELAKGIQFGNNKTFIAYGSMTQTSITDETSSKHEAMKLEQGYRFSKSKLQGNSLKRTHHKETL